MLFPANWQSIDAAVVPVIRTPLGNLCLDLQIGEATVSAHPAALYTLNTGPLLLVWGSAALTAELLITPVDPDLPSEMQITDCYAAVWRIRANQRLSSYSFSCQWSAHVRLEAGSPCSGQYLEAEEWSDGQTHLTLGTQDADAMLIYADNGGAVPSRWRQEPWSQDPEIISFVQYRPGGLAVSPPPIEAGEVLQVQFVAAWAPEREDDVATWYAVDLSPRQILRLLKDPAHT